MSNIKLPCNIGDTIYFFTPEFMTSEKTYKIQIGNHFYIFGISQRQVWNFLIEEDNNELKIIPVSCFLTEDEHGNETNSYEEILPYYNVKELNTFFLRKD